MGAAYCQHRCIYWGAALILMIPVPNSVHGWNIPYFGGPADVPPNPNSSAGSVSAPESTTQINQFFPSIISKFHDVRLKIYHFLWYKPPVGIVGAWSFLRVTEKMYGIFSPPPPASGEEALVDAEGKLVSSMKSLIPGKASLKMSPWGSDDMLYSSKIQNQKMRKQRRMRRKQNRRGRSFDLDRGDQCYDNFGGIEIVRVRAFQEGLRSALVVASPQMESSPLDVNSMVDSNDSKGDTENYIETADYSKDLEIAIGALQLSCPPKGSREIFVEQSAEALSALGKYITPYPKTKVPAASIHDQNVQLLLHHSSKLIELRTLDALLRTLRDRFIVICTRLHRTREYWKWRVNLSGGRFGDLVQAIRQRVMIVLPRMDDDYRNQNQKEYELATATWDREVEWLGKVEKMLLERPEEVEVGELLSVVGNQKQKHTSWWNIFENGRGKNGAISKPFMSSSIELLLQSKNKMWVRQAGEWSKTARKVIKDSLDEIPSSNVTSIQESQGLDEKMQVEEGAGKSSGAYAKSHFLEKWATYDDKASNAYSWLTVLSLVDCSTLPKLAVEQRRFQLYGLANRIKQLDILGVPSSALLLAAANSFHDKIIAVHKQEIVDFVKGVFTAFWGILEFRFYNPMKDIVLDLLNRRPRMVDPFALLNEQISLDNMLKDLGVGDGTRHTRVAALSSASRMYEQEVAGGTIRGIIRGRVAQLMLIQMQQLKADLLQAMDTIDSLVDANRLNVQLVASIPAVLILFFGTRALFVFWSNIRMKDFRLPRDVHAEMSDYLKKMQECLVLSNCQLKTYRQTTESSIAKDEVCLRPKEMGRMLLLLHAYLNLLDYMSPPFPSKLCDSIHQSMQNLLMQGQMSAARQLELLKVIQSKHGELLKSL